MANYKDGFNEYAKMENRKILRIGAVSDQTGLAPSTVYEWVRKGRFPKSVKLSDDPKTRATGWFSDEIQAWVDSRPQA